MPLSEREREIEKQRKAMWEGQTTNEHRTKKREEIKETGGALEPQSEHKEVEQAPEYPQKPEEAEQTPERSEKEKLAEKIRQQRRAVWREKPARKSRKKKSISARSVRRVISHQQEFGLAGQPSAYEQKAEEENRKHRSIIPSLKLALIVIIGLIGAIAIGIAIGYIVASRDLIKI